MRLASGNWLLRYPQHPCPLHGWLKVLFPECLPACPPRGPCADRPMDQQILLSCCLHSSSPSVAASCCSEEAEGGQDSGQLKFCLHLRPPKLLHSFLLRCPWRKQEPVGTRRQPPRTGTLPEQPPWCLWGLQSPAHCVASPAWSLLVF